MFILAAICIAAATITREINRDTDSQLVEALCLFASFMFLTIGVVNL